MKEMAATRTIELRTQIPGPRSREILERLKHAVASPLAVTFPVVAESARGASLTDVDGNTFIDFAGGVGCLNVGHSHPDVCEPHGCPRSLAGDARQSIAAGLGR